MLKPEDTPNPTSYPNAGKLPREVLTNPSKRFIAVLVIGALAITWAANLGAMKLLEVYPQNRAYNNLRAAWERLDLQDGSPDWLVVGDSGCGHAIATETLEEFLEGSMVKVCTIGDMGLLDDAWLLARHIERFGPPANVLIVHVYDVWQRGLPPPGLLAQVPLPLGYWQRLQPSIDLDSWQSIDVFLARFVPLVGERRSLKNLVKKNVAKVAALRGGTRDEPHEDIGVDMANVVQDFQDHREYASGTHFTMSATNLEALDHIVQLADEHGFEVYIANSPLWERLVADPAFRRYNTGVQEALATYAGRHSSVHHIDGTVAFGLHSMTQTVDHIRPEPAIDFSRDLARRIALLKAGEPNQLAGPQDSEIK